MQFLLNARHQMTGNRVIVDPTWTQLHRLWVLLLKNFNRLYFLSARVMAFRSRTRMRIGNLSKMGREVEVIMVSLRMAANPRRADLVVDNLHVVAGPDDRNE